MKLLSPNSEAGCRCIPCISKSKKLFSSFAGNVLRNLTLLFLNNFVLFHFVIKVCLVLAEFAQGSWCFNYFIDPILWTQYCRHVYIFLHIVHLLDNSSKNYHHPSFGQPQTALLENHPLKTVAYQLKLIHLMLIILLSVQWCQ